MATVTLASRELRNKATGIDIYVPRHECIPGPLGGSVLYHVIVVTRLFYFKSQGKQYKESDVVQFMIPQKYSAFEELYHKVSQKFPSVIFTPLPKKALIVNEQVITERRRVIEDVLEHIARTPKLACSSLVLEFLGAHHAQSHPLEEIAGDDGVDSQGSQAEPRQTDDTADDVDLFAADDNEPSVEKDMEDEQTPAADNDLFSLARTAAVRPVQTSSIFTVDSQENEDELGDLFIPAGAVQKKHVAIETEDNSGLLDIKDDLDKLLSVTSKPKKPPKPTPQPRSHKPVPKPRNKPKPELKPKPAAKPRFEDTTGNDDLFTTEKKTNGKEELFTPRKGSVRKPCAEEGSLVDIFKPSTTIPFPDDDEDDLFTSTAVSSPPTDMSAGDISSYIQQNMTQCSQASLDLF